MLNHIYSIQNLQTISPVKDNKSKKEKQEQKKKKQGNKKQDDVSACYTPSKEPEKQKFINQSKNENGNTLDFKI